MPLNFVGFIHERHAMKINISKKLYGGFLVIMLVNVSIILIVSKLATVTAIVTILKKQTEIKSALVDISSLNAYEERSRVIFENLGKSESIDNVRKTDAQLILRMDTLTRALSAIRASDALLRGSNQPPPALAALSTIIGHDLREGIDRYRQGTTELVAAKKAPSASVFTADRRLEEAVRTINTAVTAADSLIESQGMDYVHEIEQRVANVTRLLGVAIAGIALFSLVFGFLFSNAITSSLRRLKASTSVIGSGDFTFDASGYPADEIGDLAQAFFQMASDLKQTQDELIRKRRLAAIGEIVASVNHEINNPLMIISGNAQFLDLTIEKGNIEDSRQRIRTIIEETERISRVTKKLRQIRNPIVEDYTPGGEGMINLDKSSEDDYA